MIQSRSSSPSTNFSAYLTTNQQKIEKELAKLVPAKKGKFSQLFEAARYSLLNGGKRLRPLFTLATCECLGGNLEAALTPACVIEMIHTYSLIHDDLPCMDDDDFRRGQPTLHKVYSEGYAVLVGDFLLTDAFRLLTQAPYLNAEQKLDLIQLISSCAGGEGMIGGQMMDIEVQNQPLDLPSLNILHHYKTGCLIQAAVQCGGIVAQANSPTLQILKDFSLKLGLAYQIVDDILDVTMSEVKHGKEVSSDLSNSKTTYATLVGIEGSYKIVQDLLKLALEKLNHLPGNPSLLIELAHLITERQS